MQSESKNIKGQPISNPVHTIFPPQDFQGRYKVRKIIGKGSYGYVAKAKRKSDSADVAIKKIVNLFESLPQTRRILRQIVLLKTCKHPNIVQLIEVIIPKKQSLQNFDQIYLVTEYCDSDLQKVFSSIETFFNFQDIKFIFYQILCGLKYLHSADIVHRDLKPANVLINSNGIEIKICDFGLARVIQNSIPQKQTQDSQQQFSEEDSEEKDEFQQRMNVSDKIQEKKSCEKHLSHHNQKDLSHRHQKIRKKIFKRQDTLRVSPLPPYSKDVVSLDQKDKKKQMGNSSLSKLTLRITTRWYRAPEVILLEKQYSRSIDVWSVGCIFGELLKMQKAVCKNQTNRFPLFPGRYCYPLSPDTLQDIKKNNHPQDKNDQLVMILSTLGKPNQQQMSFLTDQNARLYVKNLECKKMKGFQQMFPQMPKRVLQILKKTITFDPRKRATIDQLLESELFEDIHDKNAEYVCEPIEMEFEGDEQSLSLQSLRQYFRKQLEPFDL